MKASLAVKGFQGGSPDHIQQVQFDPVDGPIGQESGRCQHIATGFAGQPQDDVGTDRQPPLTGALQGVGETGHIVTAIDPAQGVVAGGLQPVFHPDEIVPGIAGQQVQDRIVDTVRPGADGQADDVCDGQGFLVAFPQRLQRGVGVGKRLEIGDKFAGFKSSCHRDFALFQLFTDRQPPGKSPGAGSLGIAVNAPGGGQGAVPVGAGQPRVHGELVNAVTEAFPEVGVEIEIAFGHCFQTGS